MYPTFFGTRQYCSEVDWSVSMTSQGIVSVEWQLCMLLTMMTVMPACCNVCFLYFFYSFSILSKHDLGILF